MGWFFYRYCKGCFDWLGKSTKLNNHVSYLILCSPTSTRIRCSLTETRLVYLPCQKNDSEKEKVWEMTVRNAISIEKFTLRFLSPYSSQTSRYNLDSDKLWCIVLWKVIVFLSPFYSQVYAQFSSINFFLKQIVRFAGIKTKY